MTLFVPFILPRLRLRLAPLEVLPAALVFVAGSCGATLNDSLAERTVIGAANSFPATGSTAGMTVEPGEINESGEAAGALDQSVWFEWAAPYEGSIEFLLSFDVRTETKGLAVYTVAPGAEPLTMSRLRPAGAMVIPAVYLQPGMSFDDRLVRVRVTAGQKLILRVWSAPGPQSTGGGAAFTLAGYAVAATQRARGDLPADPGLQKFSRGPGSIVSMTPAWEDVAGPGLLSFTTETEENFISGTWHPSGCVQWVEWTAERTEEYRFSLTGKALPASVMVVRKKSDGTLERLSTPGEGATFNAVKGTSYLVRVGTSARWNWGEFTLQGGPAQRGDEPATALALISGEPATVVFAGASPSYLSRGTDNMEGRPDVWFDLGNTLAGAFKVNARSATVSIYRADDGRMPVALVAGGPGAADTAFLAESGRRYLARVMQYPVSSSAPPAMVRLLSLPPPPPNDRRENAAVLPPEGPVLIQGDATGATAEESDGLLAPEPAAVRTVWYALDRPASPQPWFVWTWNMQDGVIDYRQKPCATLFRQETPNGPLVRAELAGWPWQRCLLTGGRIWIMVSGNADPRFMLMAGPAVTPGDTPGDAVPIAPGPVRFLYAGAATHDEAVAGLSPTAQTLWLSWTATESGLVNFSHLGSPAIAKALVFTDTLTSVPVSVWNESQGMEIYGQVTSFQAVPGTSYRILLHGLMPGPVAVRLQPGGWKSPYQVWTQHFPAWENVPSLTDPEADTDGDGISNLMEMACANTLGLVVGDPPGFPWLEQTDQGILALWTERSYALRGPAGCIPFTLTGETSAGPGAWTALPFSAPGTASIQQRFWLENPQASDSSAKFFRLRVSR